ncbi:MAG TPA: hypothetical protein VFY49_05820, partial [Myxococcota bacterium]|nr:hypothetical protein [Myxococcota bacterium]
MTGNDLAIGNTADGSRAVAAQSDGPYDSATLGVADGATGTLSLDDASFTTTGTFTGGVEGKAVVDLHSGSTLATGGAVLGTATLTLDGGSSWVNGGAMTYRAINPAMSEPGPRIAIVGGATVFTDGVLATGIPNPYMGSDGIHLSIEGTGSAWWNSGPLPLYGHSTLSLTDGATARDAGVVVGYQGQSTRIVVDGP